MRKDILYTERYGSTECHNLCSLFLRPPPQVTLHAVHSDHSVHTGHGFSEQVSVSSESPEHFRLEPKVLHSLKEAKENLHFTAKAV